MLFRNIVLIIMMFLRIGISGDSHAQMNNESTIQWTEYQRSDLRNAASYEIIEFDDLSRKATTKPLAEYTRVELRNVPKKRKLRYKIVIKDMDDTQVEPTIKKIVTDIVSKDREIDELALWLYSDKDLIYGGPYDIGSVIWAYDGKLGEVTPVIVESNDRSNYKIVYKVRSGLKGYLAKRSKSETLLGYSESERRTIYKELIVAEFKATEDAERKYPNNWDQQSKLSSKLTKQYTAEVSKKYKLTEEMVDKISFEAYNENWPME